MLAATENAAMLWSLLLCTVGLFAAATERWPSLNGALRLVALPHDEFRWQLLALLSASVFGSLLWDRIVVALFAPRLMWIGYRDAYRALPTFGQLARKILVLLFWLFGIAFWGYTDNILIMGLWWYMWAKNSLVRRYLRQIDE
jgi:cation-transporting ATPase 13A1